MSEVNPNKITVQTSGYLNSNGSTGMGSFENSGSIITAFNLSSYTIPQGYKVGKIKFYIYMQLNTNSVFSVSASDRYASSWDYNYKDAKVGYVKNGWMCIDLPVVAREVKSIAFCPRSLAYYMLDTYTPYAELEFVPSSPNKPSNLSPTSGEIISGDRTNRFSWSFISQTEDKQGKYTLSTSQDTINWTEYTETTSNQYRDFPSGTFKTGNLFWKVRVFNQSNGEPSEISDTNIVLVGGKPPTPTLNIPSTLTSANPIVSWSTSGQYKYQVQVLQSNNLIEDSTEIFSTEMEYKIKAVLENNGSYTIRVRVSDITGLWSEWAEKTVLVSFIVPTVAVFQLIKNNAECSNNLIITNSTDNVKNEVYRRTLGGEWELCGECPINSTYKDVEFICGVFTEYKVRTFNSSGGYVDSNIQNSTLSLKNSELFIKGNFENRLQIKYNLKKDDMFKLEEVKTFFSGREKAVSEFSEHESYGVNLDFTLKNEDLYILKQICSSREVIVFREQRNILYGTISGYRRKDRRKGSSDISLTIEEV